MKDSNAKSLNQSDHANSRRQFCKNVALASGISILPFHPGTYGIPERKFNNTDQITEMTNPYPKSIIGPYGPWLAQSRQDPGQYSFRHSQYSDVQQWKHKITPIVAEHLASPDLNYTPVPRVIKKYQYDNLEIEELEWTLPYGHPTKAVLLKPAGTSKPLPGILGLHDHGGNKYFGLRKITRTSDDQHQMMQDHQNQYYEGRAWANEIAKRGYAVLVHDVFTFASRRVRYDEISEISWGLASTKGKSDSDPELKENIDEYNAWAAAHEHVMAKSLFSGGTTWPGMFLLEDRIALSVLAGREDVDGNRLGCAGLSGGGLRTDMLGGLDERIKCAVSVGFMSTWDDFMLHKSYTHTWMTYVPLLPAHLEFSEILALRMPLPTMVQSTTEDQLYTLPEMKRAAQILEDNFTKAGAIHALSFRFYPGPHQFNATMQEDAFNWFDRWLK